MFVCVALLRTYVIYQAKPHLDAAKDVVKFCTNHEKCLTSVHKHAERLQIVSKKTGKALAFVKYGETRFGTMILLADRLLLLKPSVQAAFDDEEYLTTAAKQPWFDTHKEIASKVHSAAFWTALEELVHLFTPMLCLLRLFDGDTPCTGKVYYQTWKLGESLKTFPRATKAQRNAAYAALHSRWELFHCVLHDAGFCLDPEYWGAEFAQETNMEVMSGFRSCALQILGEEKGSKAIAQWASPLHYP